jgi:hypothetical protein
VSREWVASVLWSAGAGRPGGVDRAIHPRILHASKDVALDDTRLRLDGSGFAWLTAT